MKKTIIQLVLSVIIIGLGYMVYESIMAPVRFNKSVDKRSAVVVQHLKDIRSAQIAYKGVYGKYIGSFDTLIDFVENGSIPVLNIIPDPNDTTFTKTIVDTIAFVKVSDSLFRDRGMNGVQHVRYVPFSKNIEFNLNAGEIVKGGVKVNVIEVKAKYEDMLIGLNEQLIINKIKSLEDIEKYPGLRFGSMTEPTIDGNWE
ncbi:MAG: hypothetical protein U9R32_04660 [Bacteroidota bacterium]|nr:hypothetical protein [Bacteroidota bacterium]